MTSNLLIIAGLPAAGKTTYLKQLLDKRLIEVYYDDFQDHSHQKSPDPTQSQHFIEFIASLKEHKAVAIADIRYCVPSNILELVAATRALVPNVRVEVRYFRNDPKACARNVKKRAIKNTDRDIEYELGLIEYYTTRFEALPGFADRPLISIQK